MDLSNYKTDIAALQDRLQSLARPAYTVPVMPRIKPISVQQAESFQEGIEEVIDEMQTALGPDEELWVYYTNGLELIRVKHIYMSSTNVAVISGTDAEGNEARVVAHYNALQFVCKAVKTTEREKVKIGFSYS